MKTRQASDLGADMTANADGSPGRRVASIDADPPASPEPQGLHAYGNNRSDHVTYAGKSGQWLAPLVTWDAQFNFLFWFANIFTENFSILQLIKNANTDPT